MKKTKMKKLIRMSSILSENFQMGRKIKERNKKKSTCFLYRIEKESFSFHKIKILTLQSNSEIIIVLITTIVLPLHLLKH